MKAQTPFARAWRVLLAVGLALAWAGTEAGAATLTITCGSSGNDLEFCFKYARQWAEKTGHTVRTFSTPTSPTDKLALYRQLFAAKSPDIDVIQIDAVWPGLLRDHLLDLKGYSRGEEAEHFPSIIANNSVDGRLLGMPWYTDAGLLYYRKDLLDKYRLPVPTTWAQLTQIARTVQDAQRREGQTDFHGFVFQGKAYEGLTCNALEWVAGFGGGTLVDAQGQITIDNEKAVAAFKLVGTWVKNISPVGVLNYEEEEARGVFQNGGALFMRNWPYAWALVEQANSPVKGRVGIARLPGGTEGQSAATLGGWQLAVNKYSANAALAAELVLYMTSASVQKQRAVQGAYNPTRPALYQDADVLRANAHMGKLQDVLAAGVARPTTATALKYPQVSQSFWNAAHEVLSQSSTAEEAVQKLQSRLKRIKRKKW